MRTLEKCPVCGSASIRASFSGFTTRALDVHAWSVSRCLACTHEFINPQPSWSELAEYYTARYQAYSSRHGSDSAATNDEQVIADARLRGEFRHIKWWPGMRLLDVGCGGGYFIRIMSRLGVVAEGLEPSEIGWKQASSGGFCVFHGTAEEYAQKSAKRQFDVVTMNHVLEHVPDPVATLRAVRQLIAPGGHVWLAVPNRACGFARLLGWRWHSTDLPFHLQQFTPASLERAAVNAGFGTNELHTYSLPSAVAAPLGATAAIPLGSAASSVFVPVDTEWQRSGFAGPQDGQLGKGEAILARMAVCSGGPEACRHGACADDDSTVARCGDM